MTSFDDILAELNESGWYLHALHQTSPIDPPTFPRWQCTIREIADKPRCQIAHGSGYTVELALYNALGAAPELEAEVSHSGEDRLDLVAALGLRAKTKPVLRRI